MIKMAIAKHLSKVKDSWKAGLGNWVESIAEFCRWKQEANDSVPWVELHTVRYVFCKVMRISMES